MKRLTNALRRYLNRDVVAHLKAERMVLTTEIARARGWDGVPADMVARYDTLTHALDLLEASYR